MKHFTPVQRALDPEAAARGLTRWYDDERSVHLGELIAEALDGRGEWLRHSSELVEAENDTVPNSGLLRKLSDNHA